MAWKHNEIIIISCRNDKTAICNSIFDGYPSLITSYNATLLIIHTGRPFLIREVHFAVESNVRTPWRSLPTTSNGNTSL